MKLGILILVAQVLHAFVFFSQGFTPIVFAVLCATLGYFFESTQLTKYRLSNELPSKNTKLKSHGCSCVGV